MLNKYNRHLINVSLLFVPEKRNRTRFLKRPGIDLTVCITSQPNTKTIFGLEQDRNCSEKKHAVAPEEHDTKLLNNKKVQIKYNHIGLFLTFPFRISFCTNSLVRHIYRLAAFYRTLHRLPQGGATDQQIVSPL